MLCFLENYALYYIFLCIVGQRRSNLFKFADLPSILVVPPPQSFCCSKAEVFGSAHPALKTKGQSYGFSLGGGVLLKILQGLNGLHPRRLLMLHSLRWLKRGFGGYRFIVVVLAHDAAVQAQDVLPAGLKMGGGIHRLRDERLVRPAGVQWFVHVRDADKPENNGATWQKLRKTSSFFQKKKRPLKGRLGAELNPHLKKMVASHVHMACAPLRLFCSEQQHSC